LWNGEVGTASDITAVIDAPESGATMPDDPVFSEVQIR